MNDTILVILLSSEEEVPKTVDIMKTTIIVNNIPPIVNEYNIINFFLVKLLSLFNNNCSLFSFS